MFALREDGDYDVLCMQSINVQPCVARANTEVRLNAMLRDLFGRVQDRDLRLALTFFDKAIENGGVDIVDEELIICGDFGVDVCAHGIAH